ncbi:MAG: ATP-dependent DNA helicase, partial [Bacteroidaceae bacterium]|nr:ATP-dependent DNA helicase [Bacteroidaceae bacterium]
VAITRAEEFLIITHAKSRFRYGKTEFCEPSRFLREIDPRFLRVKGASANTSVGTGRFGQGASSSSPLFGVSQTSSSNVRQSIPTGIDARRFVRVKPVAQSGSGTLQSNIATKDTLPVSIGTRILHDRFGSGVVTAIEGKGIDAKAKVDFDNVGIKQLLLRFAKFKVLS